MKLSSSIPFSMGHHVIRCAPQPSHCNKGLKSSASVSTIDVLAISQGLKTIVEVWDRIERKMYIFAANSVVGKLYFCGASDYMAFKYKDTTHLAPLEVK